MGLTPFACIPVPKSVRIVYPDGYVESLTRSCSVAEVLLGNSEYYICPDKPYNRANRLACDEHLESGVTYFICAAADAQPFADHQTLRRTSAPARGSRILPRLSKHHWVQGRELNTAPGSRTRVFDFHSATIQQQEKRELKSSDERGPKQQHLLKLVFIRHCLQALRLPRTSLEQLLGLDATSTSTSTTNSPPSVDETDLLPILRSAARCELGMYVSRRQEFDLRRARRRRKPMWRPVLQSISEMAPVVQFLPPVAHQQVDSRDSKRFSPPRPHGAVRRKNISPPRQQVFAGAIKAPSPSPSPPPPPPSPSQLQNFVRATKVASNAPPQQPRNRNTRSLYMA